jgi:divalent metal cation (Fe/Co/Zn/Cd) transporter
MVFVCALSLVVKEWLFRWTRRVGEKAGSRVVVANAYHHRADAWSSGIALVGVGGQLLGFPLTDAFAGLVVSLSITHIGAGLIQSSVAEFFDFQHASELRELRSVVHGVGTEHVCVVNVFATRHGHAFVLHATFLCDPLSTAKSLDDALAQLRAGAEMKIRVSEVFVNIVVADRTSEASLNDVMNLLDEFHGTSSTCDWKQRIITVAMANGGEDCFRDFEVLGKVYGCSIAKRQN